MIEGVIFDLDGVLTRTDRYHTAAWRETCAWWGIPFTDSTGNLVRGVSRMESARIVATMGGVVLTEGELCAFAEQKNNCYVRLLGAMDAQDVIPGAETLLRCLRQRGIPMAVASSSRNARMILDKTGLSGYFTVIMDGNQITRSKPNPEVFRKAADALGVPYVQCLVVEDAVSGVQAALALGCQVAALGDAASTEGVAYPLKETRDLLAVLFGRVDAALD